MDVHFEGEWTQTIDGKQFLLEEHGDDDKIVTSNNTEFYLVGEVTQIDF